MKLLLSLAACLGVACLVLGTEELELAARNFPGCPAEAKYLKNIDFVKAQGVYFVQYFSANSSHIDLSDGCCTIYYSLRSPLELGLTLCCSKDGVPTCDNGFTDARAKNFQDCRGIIQLSKDGDSIFGFVLDTDYKSYIFIADCGVLPDGTVYQNVFGFSRTVTKPPGFDRLYHETLQKNGFDLSLASPVRQGSSCVYNVPVCSSCY